MSPQKDILELINIPYEERTVHWDRRFLELLPNVNVTLIGKAPQLGPDQYPYMFIEINEQSEEPALNLLHWISQNGLGLAINPTKSAPDFVLSYGMVWNYIQSGEFIKISEAKEGGSCGCGCGSHQTLSTEAKTSSDEGECCGGGCGCCSSEEENSKTTDEDGCCGGGCGCGSSEEGDTKASREGECCGSGCCSDSNSCGCSEDSSFEEITESKNYFVGAPNEDYLPKYVRQNIREFLNQHGIMAPKILMISKDQVQYDLCFSIESFGSPNFDEHRGILQSLSWFLPEHYRFGLASENGLSHFEEI